MQLSLVFLITILSGILLSSALLPFQINSIYADESETNTDQSLAQENIGSGESVNTNCGGNSIGGSAVTDCDGGTFPTGEPPLGQPVFEIFVNQCITTQTGLVTCRIASSADFGFEGTRLTCNPDSDFLAHCFVTDEDDDIRISVDCFPKPRPEPGLQGMVCSATGPVEFEIVVENCEGDDVVVICVITAPDSLSGDQIVCAGGGHCEINGIIELFCEPFPEVDSPVRQELDCFQE